VSAGANQEVAQTVVAVFLCPSDPGGVINSDGLAPTNYLFNVGSGAGNSGAIAVNTTTRLSPDGIAYQASAIRIADITDGTSNTLAIGESIKGIGGGLAPYQDYRRQYIRDAATFNAGCNAGPSDNVWYGDRCDKWVSGSFPYAAMTFYYPPNAKRGDCLNGMVTQAWMAPRSWHPGGVNALFCDGHVAFLSDSLSQDVIHALATRNGGEVVQTP